MLYRFGLIVLGSFTSSHYFIDRYFCKTRGKVIRMLEFFTSFFSGAFGSLLTYFAGKKISISSASEELEDLITLANKSADLEVKNALYSRAAKVASHYGERRLFDLVLSMVRCAAVVMLCMTAFACIVSICAAAYASYHSGVADSIKIAGSCIEYFLYFGVILIISGLFKVIAWILAEHSLDK